MKYVLIFLLIGLITILPAYGQYMENSSDGAYPIWPPECIGGPGTICHEAPAVNFLNKAIGGPFEKSDIVVVGKIIEAKSLPEQNMTIYNVGVQYYLKNEKPHDLLNVIGDGILPKEFPGSEILVFNRPIFEKNDRVFLYLISKDGKYYLSPYSFLLDNNIPIGPPPEHAIFEYKDRYYSGEKIVISGMVQKGNLYLSVAEHHAKSEVKIRFENSTNQPFFEDKVDVKPDGTFSYVSNFSSKNAKTGSYSFSIDAGFSSTGSSFEYIAYPLKQFKSGIPIDKITCKEGLILIIKTSKDFPACVKLETYQKLVQRGWAISDKVNFGATETDLILEQSENKTITSADNGKLINIKKGESVVLKLDGSYDWRIDINNKTVIDSDYSDIRYSGSQGVYKADNSGETKLTGVGDPVCRLLEPPCMSPSILFQLNINVK